MPVTRLMRVVLLVLLLAPLARAGLGPHNVVVVVNAASPESLAVANEYVDARRIPPLNVIYLDLPPQFRESIGVDEFRSLILQPMLDQIKHRLLDGQVDCVAYSADFPHAVQLKTDVGGRELGKIATPVASINGMTYLYNQVLRKDIGYVAVNANRYAPPVHRNNAAGATIGGAGDRPVTMIPPRGFRRTSGWNADGSLLPNRPDRGYLLSTVLGITAGRGNTLDEIRQMIRRSVLADGVAPRGSVYYMANDDVRSKARQWGFKPAADKLRELGVAGQVVDGVLPLRKLDVAGVMVGIADFDWAKSGSTILPGAICEHLTSYGGIMYGTAGQTPLSAFIRAGASGTSGTVTEPFAIQEKFPSPFVHAYYAAGCSLAEAFYQSVSGPYQLLIVGDPLCKPWGKTPSLTLDGATAGATLKGAVKLKPANHTATFPLAQFGLLVDGEWLTAISPDREAKFDTADLADGYHELRLVAVASDPIASQGHLIVPVTVDNAGRRVVVTPPKSKTIAPTEAVVIDATMTGAKRLVLTHNGREVAMAAGEAGTLRVEAAKLGAGPVRVQVVGVIGDGANEQRVGSEPLRLEIAPPK